MLNKITKFIKKTKKTNDNINKIIVKNPKIKNAEPACIVLGDNIKAASQINLPKYNIEDIKQELAQK